MSPFNIALSTKMYLLQGILLGTTLLAVQAQKSINYLLLLEDGGVQVLFKSAKKILM